LVFGRLHEAGRQNYPLAGQVEIGRLVRLFPFQGESFIQAQAGKPAAQEKHAQVLVWRFG
jgi:hypothetical protein